MYLFADYHTHSQFSHGRGSIEGNIEAAWKRGLEQVAITDHGPALAFGLGVKNWQEMLRIQSKVKVWDDKYPGVKGLWGVEANVLNGRGHLDVPDEVLAQLDIVLVGLHPNILPRSLESAGLLAFYFGGKFSAGLQRRSRLLNTEALINAVESQRVDIVTHPGLKLDVDTRALARVCAQRGTALEINSAHGHLTEEFVEVAAGEGVRFAINSDAHHPRDVGNLTAGLAIAQRVGLTPDMIINARAHQQEQGEKAVPR